MSESLINLPTVVQAVKRTQRGPDEHGITQIFEQDIEIELEKLVTPHISFESTDYGVIADNATSVIDWSVKNIQKVTLTDNTNFTFIDPLGATHLSFEVIQDVSGGHTMTWPSTVDWTEGITPGSGATGKTMIVTFVFNGTRYRGQFSSYFT